MTGEIVSLLGLIASVVCGWTFAQPAADVVLRNFPTWDRTVAELACSVAIFMAVSLIFAMVAKLMRLLVKAANLSLIDHALGVVSGAARAFFLVLFIYGVMSIFSPIVPNAWVKESLAMQGASVVWPPVLKFLVGNGWINLDEIAPSYLLQTKVLETSANKTENAALDAFGSIDLVGSRDRVGH